MKILCFLTLIGAIASSSFAQKNSGFYGRTLFVEVNSAISFPMLNTVDIFGNYHNSGRYYEPDKFASALNVVVGKAVSPKLSLSLESGLFFGNFSADDDSYYYGDYYYYGNVSPKQMITRFEKLSYRTFSIMPKFEISARGGNAPGGMSHQIGVGFTSSSVVEKDYKYSIYSEYKDSIDPKRDFVDYDRKYKGVTFLYAVHMRVPITKTLLFNYGLRTTLNLTPTGNVSNAGSKDLFIAPLEAAEAIKRTRFRTVFNFELGFTYLL